MLDRIGDEFISDIYTGTRRLSRFTDDFKSVGAVFEPMQRARLKKIISSPKLLNDFRDIAPTPQALNFVISDDDIFKVAARAVRSPPGSALRGKLRAQLFQEFGRQNIPLRIGAAARQGALAGGLNLAEPTLQGLMENQ